MSKYGSFIDREEETPEEEVNEEQLAAQPAKKLRKPSSRPPKVPTPPNTGDGEESRPMLSISPEPVSYEARMMLAALLPQCRTLARYKAGHPKGKLRPWQQEFRANINKAERVLGQPETKWEGTTTPMEGETQ